MVTGAAAVVQAVRRSRGLPDLTSPQMRAALLDGATPQAAGGHIGPLPNLRGVLSAIPRPAPVITATGRGNGTATVAWNAVGGALGYEVLRKDAHAAPWSVVAMPAAPSTHYVDTGLQAGRTYLYAVRTTDGGGASPDSNHELATTLDHSDPELSTSVVVRAKHIIDVRTAVNAICTFAGTTLCPSPPFAGPVLDETYVRAQAVAAADFINARDRIAALRSAIGASPAEFTDAPASQGAVRRLHMEELRRAVQ